MRNLLIVPFFILLLTGCSTSRPIHTVQDAPVPTQASVTTHDIAKAIMIAATARGWEITHRESGLIEATLNVRKKHSAVVNISYTPSHFSIQHKESSNLHYNGQTIHRNYNKWIILLERQIRLELLKM